MSEPLTKGVHHVGLTVPDLDASERFFVDVLGWTLVGGIPSYPAKFVSDGTVTVTLWRAADPDAAVAFDRRANIGLHHLALAVKDLGELVSIHDRVLACPGTAIEFAPMPMREGSTTHHFICAMPGGVRIEFATQ